MSMSVSNKDSFISFLVLPCVIEPRFEKSQDLIIQIIVGFVCCKNGNTLTLLIPDEFDVIYIDFVTGFHK